MTAEEFVNALALPSQARVDQRVPKKHLIEHGAATSSDKKAITEGVAELIWIAALKPATVGVPIYEDAQRQYLEIAVLTLNLRAGAKAGRLRELVHRAIPYPLVLLTTAADGLTVSLCELRQAQNEAGKTVLDGEPLVARVPDDETGAAFRASLALSGLPGGDLRILYQGWMDRLIALEAAGVVGRWPGVGNADARRAAVQAIRKLDADTADCRRRAEGEPQLARLVGFNLEIQRLSAERSRLAASLT